jgi:hypothetical protein
VFIAVFTRARHWPLISGRLIYSMSFYPVPYDPFDIIPSSTYGRLPLHFPTKILYALHFSPKRATCPTNLTHREVRILILGETYKL